MTTSFGVVNPGFQVLLDKPQQKTSERMGFPMESTAGGMNKSAVGSVGYKFSIVTAGEIRKKTTST